MLFLKDNLVSINSAIGSQVSEINNREKYLIYHEICPSHHSKLQGRKLVNKENTSSMKKKMGGKMSKEDWVSKSLFIITILKLKIPWVILPKVADWIRFKSQVCLTPKLRITRVPLAYMLTGCPGGQYRGWEGKGSVQRGAYLRKKIMMIKLTFIEHLICTSHILSTSHL